MHHPHFSAFRPIAIRRWKTRRPRRRCASTGSTRPRTCCSDYGFAPDEVVYEPERQSSAGARPEGAWALAHPELFPVEVAAASYEELVRVPGIGPAAARRIVAEQRGTVSLRGLADLRKLGVVTTRAGGFLTLRGRRLQTSRWTEQLGFWAPEDEVGTHHVVYEVSPGTFR